MTNGRQGGTQATHPQTQLQRRTCLPPSVVFAFSCYENDEKDEDEDEVRLVINSKREQFATINKKKTEKRII